MDVPKPVKAHSLPILLYDKIDSPFSLQNCFFLLAAHFAQLLLSKFCQGVGMSMYDGILQSDIILAALYYYNEDGAWKLQFCSLISKMSISQRLDIHNNL